MFPPPRRLQDVAHSSLRDGFASGHRCQILGSPTGSGKTYMGLRIVKEALERGKHCLFVCDRTTLIDQTSATADRYGLTEHGVIQASHWRYRPHYKFQIASVQTLARRVWPYADVIVVDEAHTMHSAWTEHIQGVKAAVIGLSATPFSKGLGLLFSNLVNAATMAQLVDEGVLMPMRVYSCTPTDMQGAATVAGEWSDKAAEERGMKIVGDVVTEWLRYGEDRKTIVFGSTIKHCEELCRQFREAGVGAAVFTSNTTADERTEILREYRRKDTALRVLISVEALAKGFDVPDVSCVVDCRPLRKSLSTAIQMWGRGLRSAEGKTDCLLLDHSGNIIRFQKDFEDIYHNGLKSLDDGEKLDKTIRDEVKEELTAVSCPSCGFTPFHKKCMGCGFERAGKPLVEAEFGKMREFKIGKSKYGADALELWAQLATYAREKSSPDKQQGRAAHLFKDFTGDWPPRGWRVSDAPQVEVSLPVRNKIRSLAIAFSRATA